AANGLLPSVNLVGSYGGNGLSGTARPQSGTKTIFSATRLNPSCIPLPGGFLCQVSTILQPTTPFAGSPGEAWNRINNFTSYAVGVQVQVPIANGAAEGAYIQSRIARDQAELNHRNLLSQVTLDVQQSASNVTSGWKQIDASRVARELAQ